MAAAQPPGRSQLCRSLLPTPTVAHSRPWGASSRPRTRHAGCGGVSCGHNVLVLIQLHLSNKSESFLLSQVCSSLTEMTEALQYLAIGEPPSHTQQSSGRVTPFPSPCRACSKPRQPTWPPRKAVAGSWPMAKNRPASGRSVISPAQDNQQRRQPWLSTARGWLFGIAQRQGWLFEGPQQQVGDLACRAQKESSSSTGG